MEQIDLAKFSSGITLGALMVTYRGDQYLRSGSYFEVDGAKTKASHPYNYDPIMQFLADEHETLEGSTVYTDRLMQFDYEKANRLMQKHFGDTGHYWDKRAPEAIEAFMRDWNDDPELKLIAVIEYCNHATGYPTWRLDYTCN